VEQRLLILQDPNSRGQELLEVTVGLWSILGDEG
jgi:hypothetical protein